MGRLFWKFFFFFFLAQLTAVVGVGVTIWWHIHTHTTLGSIEHNPPARALVDAAAATLEHGGEAALSNLLKEWQGRPMPQVHAVNQHGDELMRRMYKTDALKEAEEYATSHSEEGDAKRVHLKNGATYLLFVPEDGNDIATFARIPPSENISFDDLLALPPDMRPIFPIKPLLAGIIASFLFAAMLALYVSKPIRQLRNAFNQASAGKLEVRISNSMGFRNDELADLGKEFDTMAMRLGTLIEGQTHLLHHVSHEMRSPLARIQLAIGLAHQNPEKLVQSIDRIELETQRIDKLVGELLQLSRLKSGVVQANMEKISLNEILRDVLENASYEAQGKGIRIVDHTHGHLTMMGGAELLHRAVENVVRNAIKYSPDGGEIQVGMDVDTETNYVHLTVSDQGPGINPEDLPNIFQPFRRFANAKGEGYGLGLAIARQVIEMHKGQIQAQNRPEGGLCIDMILPYLTAGYDSTANVNLA